MAQKYQLTLGAVCACIFLDLESRFEINKSNMGFIKMNKNWIYFSWRGLVPQIENSELECKIWYTFFPFSKKYMNVIILFL